MTSILWFDQCASTQLVAARYAALGAMDLAVVSDTQSQGQGRLERSWESATGGLYVSWIQMLRVLPLFSWLSLAVALAVVDTIAATSLLATRIKWPNDILIDGRKLAGIKVDTRIQGNIVQAIIGVGLNVNQAVFGEVASVATSLVLETGNTFSLAQVLRELDAQLRRQLELLQLDVGLIQMRHRELSATLGHSVRIHGVAGEAWGDAIGFTDQGALQIQTRSGKIEVYDGSVSCDILY